MCLTGVVLNVYVTPTRPRFIEVPLIMLYGASETSSISVNWSSKTPMSFVQATYTQQAEHWATSDGQLKVLGG